MSMRRLLPILALLALVLPARAAAGTTITQYASALAGQPTPVHCQPMPKDSDWLGYVYESASDDGTAQTEGPDIYLAPETCYPLALAMRHATPGTYTARFALATALLTLTHEALHVKLNSGNESTVECNALLRIDHTIRMFGLTRQLKVLHALAWASHWDEPDEYLQDPVCRAHPHEGVVALGPIAKPHEKGKS